MSFYAFFAWRSIISLTRTQPFGLQESASTIRKECTDHKNSKKFCMVIIIMAGRISAIAFEHHREALGIGESQPGLSWEFESTAFDWYKSHTKLLLLMKVSVFGRIDS